MMKLQFKIRDFCCLAIIAMMSLFLAGSYFLRAGSAFAENENSDNAMHFVTIYDDGEYATVKTSATTVREVLERAKLTINESDLVEPGLDAEINNNDYNINIYRARPAIVIDGIQRRYIMTASYDPATIAFEAGLTIYDGDEIRVETNQNFLEAGLD